MVLSPMLKSYFGKLKFNLRRLFIKQNQPGKIIANKMVKLL